MQAVRNIDLRIVFGVDLEESERWDEKDSQTNTTFQVNRVNIWRDYSYHEKRWYWRVGLTGKLRKVNGEVGLINKGRNIKFDELPDAIQEAVRRQFDDLQETVIDMIPDRPE